MFHLRLIVEDTEVNIIYDLCVKKDILFIILGADSSAFLKKEKEWNFIYCATKFTIQRVFILYIVLILLAGKLGKRKTQNWNSYISACFYIFLHVYNIQECYKETKEMLFLNVWNIYS